MDIYLGSVGRGANLLLNVPVNREGLIAREDSVRLMEFRAALDNMFAVNIATSAKVTAEDKKAITVLTDQNTTTYWSPKTKELATVVLEWKKPQTINHIVLREHIELVRNAIVRASQKPQ